MLCCFWAAPLRPGFQPLLVGLLLPLGLTEAGGPVFGGPVENFGCAGGEVFAGGEPVEKLLPEGAETFGDGAATEGFDDDDENVGFDDVEENDEDLPKLLDDPDENDRPDPLLKERPFWANASSDEQINSPTARRLPTSHFLMFPPL